MAVEFGEGTVWIVIGEYLLTRLYMPMLADGKLFVGMRQLVLLRTVSKSSNIWLVVAFDIISFLRK